MELDIKEGLRFTINALEAKKDKNSFLIKEHSNLVLKFEYSGTDCGLNFNESQQSNEIMFVFHTNYFKNYFSDGKSFNPNQFPAYMQHDICCYDTQMILHEIVKCKLTGMFRNIFLESKALALLLCFHKCKAVQPDCVSCKFLTKPVEKEKILKAREIILSNLNNVPTIAELSLQTGINQCYLKKGFKEVFGTTIYDFVQDQRMMKAKLLLTTTQLTVSMVADEIGFSSISNFSSAFKKYAGVFPSELQKN